MTERLEIGLEYKHETVVTEKELAEAMGNDEIRTYSSPSMILNMEVASGSIILPRLNDTETIVGYNFNIKHVAPAMVGAVVETHSRLCAIERNKLTFDVKAESEGRTLGYGTYECYVINKKNFMEKAKELG